MASFSENVPAEIEYRVIVSNIEDVGSHWHDNKPVLEMPVSTRSRCDIEMRKSEGS
jgi:hypothetical protein